jgi:hypothetical protein
MSIENEELFQFLKLEAPKPPVEEQVRISFVFKLKKQHAS